MNGSGIDARIARYLERATLAGHDPQVEPLAGDASSRRYVRLRVSGLSPCVIALYPEDDATGPATFVEVAALFAAVPLPVPGVVARADDLGLLVLEDLGDTSLQQHLATASAVERARRYRDAVALLVTLQQRGAELAVTGAPPYALAFDVEKLTWELDFFTTHFLEGHLQAAITPAAREALGAEYAALARALAAEPRVLCHRDYHSRNLMVQDDRLRVIDFQDARMGPDTYDLASLLRDAYVELSAGEVDAYVRLFLHLRAAASGVAADEPARRAFRRRFDLMAVQRTLKALGTFGFQASARGNPAYLSYVPRTLANARASLATSPACARLRQLLSELVPELG